MKTSKDFSRLFVTASALELVEANVTYVKGVIYSCDLEKVKFVTPDRTFNGWACDCWPVKARGSGFELDTTYSRPIPVKTEYLLEPVAVILGS